MFQNKKFVLFTIFFLFAIFLSLFDIAVEKIYFESYMHNAALNEATDKSIERENVFKSFLEDAEESLIDVSKKPQWVGYLNTYDNNKEIEQLFLFYAQMKPSVMQIRYIDKNGLEKIRIDRDAIKLDPYIVSQDKLQDKSKRDYFIDAQSSPSNKVVFSSLDLNIEHGKIEIPYKPTIRVMLPLSKNGEFDGIIIVNYFVKDLLSKVINAISYDITLFDQDGYIIVHKDDEKNWGKYKEAKFHISNEISQGYQKVFETGIVQTDKFLVRKLNLPLKGNYYMALTFSHDMKEQFEEYKKSEYIFEIVFVGLSSLILSFLIIRYFSSTLLDLDYNKKILNRLKLSTKASKIGLYEYDPIKDSFYYSNEIYEIFGLEERHRAMSKTLFLSFFTTESKIQMENIFDTDFQDDTLSFEVSIHTVDGQIRYLQNRIEKVVDNDKRIMIYGSLYDITQTKQHQQEMQNQTQYLNSVLSAMSNLVIVSNGQVIYGANQKLLDFYGVDDTKTFKEKYDCICDTFLECEGFLQKYTADGTTWLEELSQNHHKQHLVKIEDKNGIVHIFDVNISSQKIQNKYYVITFNDITQLHGLQNNLELEIQNKSQELIQKDQLLLGQSKLAAMGSMIANIAHQWKQPLSVISSTASGISLRYKLGVTVDKNMIVEDMNDIVERVNYLSENINTFRNFLREDKVFRKLKIQDEIQTALNISSLMLVDNGIKLINNIDYNNILELDLVKGELPEVIINIINNAKDALTEKFISDPWVKIDLEYTQKNITLSIEDNAGGIPEDFIENIFDEYFTTKADDKGTGLGLFMSKQIIEKSLGGKIYVANTQNGAKFYIEFSPIQRGEV